jgi:hypothetical protein
MGVRMVDHLEGAGCAETLSISLNIATAQDGGTHGGSSGRRGLRRETYCLSDHFHCAGWRYARWITWKEQVARGNLLPLLKLPLRRMTVRTVDLLVGAAAPGKLLPL